MVFPLGFAENSIQLVPDGTLILHVLIILVMVYVLNATLYKPINRILEAREKQTKGRLTEAQEILKDRIMRVAFGQITRGLKRLYQECILVVSLYLF